MKKLLLLLIIFLFISCEKPSEPPFKNPNLIEELTIDSNGVVFKIINDVDSSYNYLVDLVHWVDSIYIKKFDSEDKRWFSKHGEYVCWRYNYVDFKIIEIGFVNKFPKTTHQKICSYSINYFFNKPIEDTVYFKLSTIFPVK